MMKRCGTKTIARHNDVLARLASFEKLDRKTCDQTDWIALAYGCNRNKAHELIDAAREYQMATVAATVEA